MARGKNSLIISINLCRIKRLLIQETVSQSSQIKVFEKKPGRTVLQQLKIQSCSIAYITEVYLSLW